MINTPRLTAVVVVALISAGQAAHAASGIDAALDEARAARTALKADPAKKKFRHQWQNVARRFEQIAAKYPKSERLPECDFAAAELYRELSQFSQDQEDLDAAISSYRKVLAEAPAHTLADDAALALGKLLADRKNDPAGARKVLSGYDDRGDKKNDILAVLKRLPDEKKEVAKKGDDKRAAKVVDEKKPVKAAPEEKKLAAKTVDERAARKSVDDRTAKNAADDVRAARKIADDDLRARRPAARLAADDTADMPTKATDRLKKALSPIASAFARASSGSADDDVPAPSERRAARMAPTSVRRNLPADDETMADDPDAVDEGPAAPPLASLTERLRDVRVGERPVDEAATKLHFKQMTKALPGSELTLAEQLGLKVKRVIIDAGHGGHDTGAIGKGGTREKDVTLSIVMKLKGLLEESGFEVLLTRDDDTYVKLEDRTRFANQHKGDLFVSVHCNSAPTNKLRGVETYTLNTSSDRYAIRLAARENAATERGVGDLQLILADLATKANTSESTRLAERVQRSVVAGVKTKNPGVKDLGHKEALFFVLLGARMPAILVETSFLSHPDEEKLLASDGYQDDLAAAIADGVSEFVTERNKVATLE